MLYREPEVSRMLAREHHERLAKEARRRRRAVEQARPEPVGAASVLSRWVWRWRMRRAPAYWT